MGDEQRDGDGDINGDDGGDCDETLGFQDMVVRRSEERSEPCPVRRLGRLFCEQEFPKSSFTARRGREGGCSSSLGIDCQAVPPRWRPLGTITRRCARVDNGKWALGQTAFDSEVRQIAERCGGVPKILVPVTHNLEG